MPKMVIWVAPVVYENEEMDARLYHPGDVIQVLPDDHVFGTEEVKHPNWKIVDCAMSDLEAKAFESEEQGDLFKNPLLLRRQFKVDLTALKPTDAVKMAAPNDGKAIPILPEDIRAAKTIKTSKVPPQIIGDEPAQVIG